MTPRWGTFPFCNAPVRDGVQTSQNLWPAGFTADQIMDVFLNYKTIDFSILAVPDVTDARIAIDQASSVLNTGQLLAVDVAMDMAAGPLRNRDGVNGKMERRTDSAHCTGVKFVYNKNLTYFELSFYPVVDARSGKTLPGVVRVPRGNYWLYHPRFLMVFWASGYVFSNSASALYGAGTCVGVVDFEGGSVPVGGGLNQNEIYYAPAGTGNAVIYSNQGFSASERIDQIVFSPRPAAKGTTVVLSGATFDPTATVSIGRVPALSTVAADQKSISLVVPENAPREPILVSTAQAEIATREYFRPA